MKRNTKYILIVIVVLTFLVGLYAYREYQRKPVDLSTIQSQSSVSAGSLINLYTENEAKANLNYLGKTIDVTGRIADIINQNDTLVNVLLGKTDDMHKVSCLLDVHHINDVKKYKIGDNIIVRGNCNGYLMDVELNRCVIIKPTSLNK